MGDRGQTFKAECRHATTAAQRLAKQIAIELTCRPIGLTQRAIGAYYGGISSGAVCMARRNIGDHADAAKIIQRLQESVSPQDDPQSNLILKV